MTLSEILAAIGAYVGTDAAKAKEVARELRNAAETKPVAQLLINAGAGKKKGETDGRITELEAQIATLTDEKDDLAQQLEAAKGKPDEQKAEFERQLKRVKDQLAAATQERDAEREGRKGDRVVSHADRVKLHLKGRVDDDYLTEVVSARIQKRLRPSESGVQFLGDDDEPLDGEGEAVEKALAEEVFKGVPEKFRLRQMNPGGGANGGGHDGGPIRQKLDEEKQESGAYRM